MRRSRSLARLQALERSLCVWCNRRSAPTLHLLQIVSKLGDGVIWFFLSLLGLLLGWESGTRMFLLLAAGTVTNIVLYTVIKHSFGRGRPFTALDDIQLLERPLDRYSFPSGHTMHAAFYAALMSQFAPGLAWVLWPFAALIAASRVALGLHYPTDVLAGAALGVGVAAIFAGAV